MNVFTSPFWSVYIVLLTVVGFVFLFVLIWWQSRGSPGGQDHGHVWDENLRELNNPLPRWWLNLFYLTLFFGIGYLILYPGLGAFPGVLNWSQIDQYDAEIERAAALYDPMFERYAQIPIPDLAEDPEAFDIGQRLYLTYCSVCHGSDARGVRGFPNLRDHEWLWGGTPEAITTSIRDGRQAIMTPWRDVISREEIFNAAQYVRHLAGRDIDPVVRLRGKAVYDSVCFACHGMNGEGNQLLGAPNLTDDVWLYGGTQAAIIESISEGRNGVMPPHQEFLGEARIHLLATYVYALSNLRADEPPP